MIWNKVLKNMMVFFVLAFPISIQAANKTVNIENTTSQIFYLAMDGKCDDKQTLYVIPSLKTMKLFQNVLRGHCENRNACLLDLHADSCTGSVISTITLDMQNGITGVTTPTGNYFLEANGFNLKISAI